IDSEATGAATECPVWVCAAASSIRSRLKVELGIIRTLQYAQLRLYFLHSPLLCRGEWVRRNSFFGSCSWRQCGNERTLLNLHIPIRDSQNVGESRAADFLLLPCAR